MPSVRRLKFRINFHVSVPLVAVASSHGWSWVLAGTASSNCCLLSFRKLARMLKKKSEVAADGGASEEQPKKKKKKRVMIKVCLKPCNTLPVNHKASESAVSDWLG
eukprot:1157229-Pelagomonas_calceolata.AAC.1